MQREQRKKLLHAAQRRGRYTRQQRAYGRGQKVAAEAAAEAAAKPKRKRSSRLVKVKAQRRFLDKELNQIKDTGDVYTVSRERAAVLEEAGVAAVMAE